MHGVCLALQTIVCFCLQSSASSMHADLWGLPAMGRSNQERIQIAVIFENEDYTLCACVCVWGGMYVRECVVGKKRKKQERNIIVTSGAEL